MNVIQCMVWCLCVVFCFAQPLTVVQNELVKIVVSNPSQPDYPRFSIETTGGDPSHSKDDNLPLIYGRPKPWTSYTTIAINDEQYVFGTKTNKRAGKSALYGTVLDTQITEESIRVSGELGGIVATQTLSLFRNPLTQVKDTVLIEYALKNNTSVTKNVGLRIMMDTLVGKNDAAPFRIGESAIQAETAYVGDDVLDFWQSFDSLATPSVIAQGMLRYPPAGLTPPDQFILKNWGALADAVYNVDVQKGASFIRDGEDEPDTALALLYNQTPLGPNQTRVFRTAMGLGGVSVAPGDVSLGLTAPATLALTDPNTYTIIAYISNTGGFTAKNAKATIQLPPGLKRVKGESTVLLGDILPSGSRQIMMVVAVDPSRGKEGVVPIQLLVQSDTFDLQTLSRNIQLTGQPKLSIRPVGQPTIKRGVDQFVDVPILVKNESPVTIPNVAVSADIAPPFILPLFETTTKSVQTLMPNEETQVAWKLKITQWNQALHSIPITIASDFTPESTIKAPVQIQIGKPNAKLYYSDSHIDGNDYGYVWITLRNMDAFSGLDLSLHWDDATLQPIRVSPEPWLISLLQSQPDTIQMTDQSLQFRQIQMNNPTWRLIIAKWHFKALKTGPATVVLKQGNETLDQITIQINESKNKEAL